MAKKSGLHKAAVKIGATIGKAEATARGALAAAQQGKKDFEKRIRELARRVDRSKKHLDRAIRELRG